MRTWASAGGGRGGECPGDAHGCGASRSCLKLCVLVCTCYYLRLFILPLNKTPISGDVSILQLNNRACLIDLHAKNAVTLGRILSLYTYSIYHPTSWSLRTYVLTPAPSAHCTYVTLSCQSPTCNNSNCDKKNVPLLSAATGFFCLHELLRLMYKAGNQQKWYHEKQRSHLLRRGHSQLVSKD